MFNQMEWINFFLDWKEGTTFRWCRHFVQNGKSIERVWPLRCKFHIYRHNHKHTFSKVFFYFKNKLMNRPKCSIVLWNIIANRILSPRCTSIVGYWHQSSKRWVHFKYNKYHIPVAHRHEKKKNFFCQQCKEVILYRWMDGRNEMYNIELVLVTLIWFENVTDYYWALNVEHRTVEHWALSSEKETEKHFTLTFFFCCQVCFTWPEIQF